MQIRLQGKGHGPGFWNQSFDTGIKNYGKVFGQNVDYMCSTSDSRLMFVASQDSHLQVYSVRHKILFRDYGIWCKYLLFGMGLSRGNGYLLMISRTHDLDHNFH